MHRSMLRHFSSTENITRRRLGSRYPPAQSSSEPLASIVALIWAQFAMTSAVAHANSRESTRNGLDGCDGSRCSARRPDLAGCSSMGEHQKSPNWNTTLSRGRDDGEGEELDKRGRRITFFVGRDQNCRPGRRPRSSGPRRSPL